MWLATLEYLTPCGSKVLPSARLLFLSIFCYSIVIFFPLHVICLTAVAAAQMNLSRQNRSVFLVAFFGAKTRY